MTGDLAPNKVSPAPNETANDADPGDLAAEDFYREGPYLIFTAVFHQKRGFCCNSDCRHCPYK